MSSVLLERTIFPRYLSCMSESNPSQQLPPSVERLLRHFRAMSREEKMAALVQYAKKLEPLPERFKDVDRGNFTVPECQTRVDIFPELRDGRLHFYADLNVRQSPTIAAFLSILFSAVNDEPPSTTLAIPGDFARVVMESIGLGTREVGLNAMVTRLKRYARDAESAAA
jgi:cysteine desulfuration protein SufE